MTTAGSYIAFVSGRYRWTWDTTINEFYYGRRTALDTATKPPTLVLQETLTDVPSGTTYELPPLITDSQGIDADDITVAPRLRQIKVISGNELYGVLCGADSHEAAALTIAARIDEVLRD